MNISQKFDKLKTEIYDMASTSIELCSYPPQHPFAAGTSVEQVITKINDLESEILLELKTESQTNIPCPSMSYILGNLHAMEYYIRSYVKSNGPSTKKFIQGLYDYLNKTYIEINKFQNRGFFKYYNRIYNKIINHTDSLSAFSPSEKK